MSDIGTVEGAIVLRDQVTAPLAAAAQAVKDFFANLAGFGSQATGLDKAKGSSEALSGSLKDLLRSATELVGVGVGLKEFFDAIAQKEDSVARLGQAVEVMRGATAEDTAALRENAEALSVNTRFSSDAITNAEALAMKFQHLGGDVMAQLIKASMDYASVTGTDLTDAVNVFGRALDNPQRGMMFLQRLGLVDKAQADLIKKLADSGQQVQAQEIIIDTLAEHYAQGAERMRDTMGGALTALKSAAEEGMATAGSGFLSGLVKAAADTFTAWISGSAAAHARMAKDWDEWKITAVKDSADVEIALLQQFEKDALFFSDVFSKASTAAGQAIFNGIKAALDAVLGLEESVIDKLRSAASVGETAGLLPPGTVQALDTISQKIRQAQLDSDSFAKDMDKSFAENAQRGAASADSIRESYRQSEMSIRQDAYSRIQQYVQDSKTAEEALSAEQKKTLDDLRQKLVDAFGAQGKAFTDVSQASKQYEDKLKTLQQQIANLENQARSGADALYSQDIPAFKEAQQHANDYAEAIKLTAFMEDSARAAAVEYIVALKDKIETEKEEAAFLQQATPIKEAIEQQRQLVAMYGAGKAATDAASAAFKTYGDILDKVNQIAPQFRAQLAAILATQQELSAQFSSQGIVNDLQEAADKAARLATAQQGVFQSAESYKKSLIDANAQEEILAANQKIQAAQSQDLMARLAQLSTQWFDTVEEAQAAIDAAFQANTDAFAQQYADAASAIRSKASTDFQTYLDNDLKQPWQNAWSSMATSAEDTVAKLIEHQKVDWKSLITSWVDMWIKALEEWLFKYVTVMETARAASVGSGGFGDQSSPNYGTGALESVGGTAAKGAATGGNSGIFGMSYSQFGAYLAEYAVAAYALFVVYKAFIEDSRKNFASVTFQGTDIKSATQYGGGHLQDIENRVTSLMKDLNKWLDQMNLTVQQYGKVTIEKINGVYYTIDQQGWSQAYASGEAAMQGAEVAALKYATLSQAIPDMVRKAIAGLQETNLQDAANAISAAWQKFFDQLGKFGTSLYQVFQKYDKDITAQLTQIIADITKQFSDIFHSLNPNVGGGGGVGSGTPDANSVTGNTTVFYGTGHLLKSMTPGAPGAGGVQVSDADAEATAKDVQALRDLIAQRNNEAAAIKDQITGMDMSATQRIKDMQSWDQGAAAAQAIVQQEIQQVTDEINRLNGLPNQSAAIQALRDQLNGLVNDLANAPQKLTAQEQTWAIFDALGQFLKGNKEYDKQAAEYAKMKMEYELQAMKAELVKDNLWNDTWQKWFDMAQQWVDSGKATQTSGGHGGKTNSVADFIKQQQQALEGSLQQQLDQLNDQYAQQIKAAGKHKDEVLALEKLQQDAIEKLIKDATQKYLSPSMGGTFGQSSFAAGQSSFMSWYSDLVAANNELVKSGSPAALTVQQLADILKNGLGQVAQQLIGGWGIPLEQTRDQVAKWQDEFTSLGQMLDSGAISLDRYGQVLAELGQQVVTQTATLAQSILDTYAKATGDTKAAAQAAQLKAQLDQMSYAIQIAQLNVEYQQLQVLAAQGQISSDLISQLGGIVAYINNLPMPTVQQFEDMTNATSSLGSAASSTTSALDSARQSLQAIEEGLKSQWVQDVDSLNQKFTDIFTNIGRNSETLSVYAAAWEQLRQKYLQGIVDLDTQLRGGSISGGTIATQFDFARQQFQKYLAQVQGGDLSQSQNLQTWAQNYVQLLGQMFGTSTGYYSTVVASVRASLESIMGVQLGGTGIGAAGTPEFYIVNAVNSQTTAIIGAIQGSTTAIVGALGTRPGVSPGSGGGISGGISGGNGGGISGGGGVGVGFTPPVTGWW